MGNYQEQFDLPYDPAAPGKQGGTLPMEEVIRRALIAHTLKLKVCLPCSITNVRGNQEVDVQPLIQARYTSGAPFNLPPIQKVPVAMPMGADYSIKLPIAVGDTGFCIFSDRSLDVWLAGSGGIVDPQDSRQHDISDAIFYPGLVPYSGQTTDSTTDLVITNGSAKLAIQKAGTYKIANGSQELLSVLDTFFGQVNTLTQRVTDVNMQLTTLATDLSSAIIDVFGIGPAQAAFDASTIANFASVLAQLATIASELGTLASSFSTSKSNLDTLKGS